MVHILVVVKGVLPNDLEPMMFYTMMFYTMMFYTMIGSFNGLNTKLSNLCSTRYNFVSVKCYAVLVTEFVMC